MRVRLRRESEARRQASKKRLAARQAAGLDSIQDVAAGEEAGRARDAAVRSLSSSLGEGGGVPIAQEEVTTMEIVKPTIKDLNAEKRL